MIVNDMIYLVSQCKKICIICKFIDKNMRTIEVYNIFIIVIL